ncbi:MAG: nickel-dependent lactate racemase [Anaerolineae bacterium]|nr:nickel-dependent lactate racemase [Anaerolineae bacterium]
MNVHLAYGKNGLDVNLPSNAQITVIEPHFVPGLPDEIGAMREALRHPIDSPPLHKLVSPGQTVAVVFSDLTRPQPRERMLPVLLDELASCGVAAGNILLINALGTHRPSTDAELHAMLGGAIVDGYRVIQHDATDKASMVNLGLSSYGHEVWINRAYLDADVKILTGFIEPHIFAGFSGGPKAVLPGVAGMEIILDNHNGPMLSAPTATWGVTRGNAIWEEMLEVAQMTRPDFLFNVTLNKNKQICGVFAGDLVAAHQAGIEQVKAAAMVAVDAPFDVVLTTNSGYPLDINLYQSVKGISAAAQVTRPGGAILIASECWDGVPEFGNYKQFLQEAASPQAMLDRVLSPGFRMHDQWEAFLHAKLCLHADIYVYANGLSDDDIRMAMMTPSRDIEATLDKLIQTYGPRSSAPRLCVMPEGPMTIPYVKREA